MKHSAAWAEFLATAGEQPVHWQLILTLLEESGEPPPELQGWRTVRYRGDQLPVTGTLRFAVRFTIPELPTTYRRGYPVKLELHGNRVVIHRLVEPLTDADWDELIERNTRYSGGMGDVFMHQPTRTFYCTKRLSPISEYVFHFGNATGPFRLRASALPHPTLPGDPE